MKETLNVDQADTQQDNGALFIMLDRGIDDMGAGRETPVEEAFKKITELSICIEREGADSLGF